MIEVTVKSLAKEIQISVDLLIQQFADAGIHKTELDYVTQREKEILLVSLNKDRKNCFNKLTLRRKVRSVLSISGVGGKNKQVQIEVRKKKIYITPEIQADTNKINSNKIENSMVNYEEHFNVLSKNSVKSHTINSDTLSTNISNQIECDINSKAEQSIDPCNIVENDYGIVKDEKCKFHHLTGSKEIVNCNIDDINNISVKEIRDHKVVRDRRVRSRVRYKSRGGKSVKYKKVTTNQLYDFGVESEESHYVVSRLNKNKRRLNHNIVQNKVASKPLHIISRNVVIGDTISISELANKMAIKSSQLIKVMMDLGIEANVNQIINQDIAQLITEHVGHHVILRKENELEEFIMNDRDIGNSILAESRPPIVTFMGHVDHGKTTLLDYIRSAKVVSSEFGGITQHIGAYHVKINDSMITFLDTPGHSAFTAMRARGVKITDIVVLVVAIDDGVMLQTIEAINHAKSVQVPIIVVINKIDKEGYDALRIKNELAKYDVIPEEWGGDVQFVNVSAKRGTGIDNLFESILLQTEILELKSVRDCMASGIILESYLDKGRGLIASILVREGTLKVGDVMLCGLEYGRVRYMRDEYGNSVISAGPSIPVEVIGFSGLPTVGDVVTVVRNERKAREVALYRQEKFREIKLTSQKRVKFDHIFSDLTACNGVCVLNIILKSDVQGSSEAICYALEKLSNESAKINLIHVSVGGVTENDITLAISSNAIILGFNVCANSAVCRFLDEDKVDIRYYCVIYDLINDVKKILEGLLTPKCMQEIVGLAEVRNIFCSPKFGVIAGCMITEGTMKRHNKIRILRNKLVIYEGEFESLRRFKDDVKEVRHGMECGIGIRNFNNIRSGDIIEVFERNKI